MRRVCISMHQHVPRAVEIELDAAAAAAAASRNCGAVQAAISHFEFVIEKEKSSLTVDGQSSKFQSGCDDDQADTCKKLTLFTETKPDDAVEMSVTLAACGSTGSGIKAGQSPGSQARRGGGIRSKASLRSGRRA